MSSSSMTEEQRRRMEENRQKALQKRAEAASRASQNVPTGNASNSNFTREAPSAKPFNNTQSNRSVPNPQTQYKNHVQSQPVPAKSNESKPQQTQFPSGNKGPPVTGTCRLISRDRFAVDLPFNRFYNEANNIFKSVNGNQFDANIKKWHFPVSEHENFISAMEVLKPYLYVGGIPTFVLRALRQNGTCRRPSDINLALSPIDPVLLKMLMPFQAEGVCFGISREGRVLIADDMGLGKTIQALGIAHYYFREWPLLIVTPSSMRYAWREAIWNWLPSVNAGSVAVVESNKDSIMSASVIITSYDLLSKKAEDLERCRVVIMDESHHLKNFKTVRAKAALPILQNARRAILLSGTPALSRPIELYTQLSAINRRLFPGQNEYGIRYCAGKQNAWGWDFNGSSNMEELQIVLEGTCMIRRLKSDVLTQLPSKRRQMLLLDPALIKLKSKSLQTTAKSYNAHVNLKSMEKRGKLLEYYSETAKAKIDAIAAYVKDLVEDNKKFLCFAHHRSVLDGVCETLESLRCKYIRIDGSTPSEERNKLVDMFQFNDSVLVAVLSITAANTGITLTAAHLVVFAELFWNPGILTQAEDRAHRIGQLDSVLIQYLVAAGTADDVLWPMVQGKLDVLNKAGLSKDNFREADANSLIQSSNNPQKGINDFFKPVSTSGSIGDTTAEDSLNNDDGSVLFGDDDDELLQLMEESSNESKDSGTEGGASSFKSPNYDWNKNNSNVPKTNGNSVQPKKLKM